MPARARGPSAAWGKVVCEYANRLAATHHTVHIVYAAAACPERLTWRGRLRRRRPLPLLPAYGALLREGVVPCCTRGSASTSSARWPAPAAPHDVLRRHGHTDRPGPQGVPRTRHPEILPHPALRELGILRCRGAESYRYGYRNIAIASWLQRLVEAAGAPCELIHNGFDFDFFRMSVDYTRKEAMPRGDALPHKRVEGLPLDSRPCGSSGERCPGELKVSLFGVPPALPDWIEYFRQPDSETFNRIYKAAIYLGPGLTEGWGSPSARR